MDAVRLIALCVAVAAVSVVIRVQRPEMALALSLVTGVVVLGYVVGKLSETAYTMTSLAQQAGLRTENAGLVLRVAGIACLGEFGAQMCRDAGEGALASRIEMGGRIILLGMATPLIVSLMQRIVEMLP